MASNRLSVVGFTTSTRVGIFEEFLCQYRLTILRISISLISHSSSLPGGNPNRTKRDKHFKPFITRILHFILEGGSTDIEEKAIHLTSGSVNYINVHHDVK